MRDYSEPSRLLCDLVPSRPCICSMPIGSLASCLVTQALDLHLPHHSTLCKVAIASPSVPLTRGRKQATPLQFSFAGTLSSRSGLSPWTGYCHRGFFVLRTQQTKCMHSVPTFDRHTLGMRPISCHMHSDGRQLTCGLVAWLRMSPTHVVGHTVGVSLRGVYKPPTCRPLWSINGTSPRLRPSSRALLQHRVTSALE